MLSAVSASSSSEFTLLSHLQNGGGGTAGATSQQIAAQAVLALVSQGQSGAKLADLLGVSDVRINDVLTQLALKFASAEGMKPVAGENLQAFTARVADAILSMPPLERIAAESKAGLMGVGISAAALANALKNPTSVEAARLVALIETRLTSPQDAALKTAISQYQQTAGRDAEAPARASAEQVARPQVPQAGGAPRADAVSQKGVEVLRLLQGGQTQAASPIQPQQTGEAARLPSLPVNVKGEQIRSAATGDLQAEPAKVQPQAVNPERRAEGIPLRQAAEGLKAAFPTLKDNAFSLIPTTGAPASQVVTEAQRRVLSALPALDAGRAMLDQTESQDAIARRAQQAALALAQKQAALFAAAPAAEEADGDLEKQISRALGDANRTSQALAAARSLTGGEQSQQAAAQTPVGVPFAQVPYPLVQTGETKRKGARDEDRDDEEDDREDGQDSADEQSMQGGGEDGAGKKAANSNAEPIEENPFEAEEPLDRHASDADRAYHMYQKFGGF